MVSGLVYRLLLPVCLTAACVLRYNCFSLVYLVVLLLLPLLPESGAAPKEGHAGRVVKAVCGLSLLFVCMQICFQVTLSTLLTSGHLQPGYNCSSWERSLRQLGLESVSGSDPGSILRIFFPDVVVFLPPSLPPLRRPEEGGAQKEAKLGRRRSSEGGGALKKAEVFRRRSSEEGGGLKEAKGLTEAELSRWRSSQGGGALKEAPVTREVERSGGDKGRPARGQRPQSRPGVLISGLCGRRAPWQRHFLSPLDTANEVNQEINAQDDGRPKPTDCRLADTLSPALRLAPGDRRATHRALRDAEMMCGTGERNELISSTGPS
ncbi:unnamed protein product [Boreogadus saida]